ncbi:hypothetical protein [Salmonella enterica]|uniref:phosphotriesterase family protein n=1 Tax=Salmonella enterica TaxID=28901 RepID=UPI00398C34E3
MEGHGIDTHVERLAARIGREMNQWMGAVGVRAGMIGEIGVSPAFTQAERNSLRAASRAQCNNPHTAINHHMPGWLLLGAGGV